MNYEQLRKRFEEHIKRPCSDEEWDTYLDDDFMSTEDPMEPDLKYQYSDEHLKKVIDRYEEYEQECEYGREESRGNFPQPSAKVLSNSEDWVIRNEIVLSLINEIIKAFRKQVFGSEPLFIDFESAHHWLHTYGSYYVSKRRKFNRFNDMYEYLSSRNPSYPSSKLISKMETLKQKEEARRDEVRQMASKLKEVCGWSDIHTYDFLLTGKKPPPMPITISIDWDGPRLRPQGIVLIIDPRVSGDDVKAYYRRAKADMQRYQKTSRKNHDRCSYELVRFVLNSPDLKWKDRLNLWNKEYPEFQNRWKSDKSMATSYKRIRNSLLMGVAHTRNKNEEQERAQWMIDAAIEFINRREVGKSAE